MGRGGDMVTLLMRVVEGQIDPPQQRAPERARAGWIPPELSAIAMKALAMKSLVTIDNMPAQQFWQKWEAAKSKGK